MNSAKFFIKPFFVDPPVVASQRVSTGKQLSLPHVRSYVLVFTLPPSRFAYVINKWPAAKLMEDIVIYASREIWRWERIGILEYHRNLWCIFQFSVGFPATLKCYRSHWKAKKVFLNVQNMRKDNFNLVKSLRKTCKLVHFFTKKWCSQSSLSKLSFYFSLYFKDIVFF